VASALRELNATINQLSPIHRLPTETLASILELAATDIPVRKRLEMSHVCSHWMKVMISDAKIWQTIDLARENTGFSAATLTSILERSKSLSLSITIDRDLGYNMTQQQATFACLQEAFSRADAVEYVFDDDSSQTSVWARVFSRLRQRLPYCQGEFALQSDDGPYMLTDMPLSYFKSS
jgi:hypothetical protein